MTYNIYKFKQLLYNIFQITKKFFRRLLNHLYYIWLFRYTDRAPKFKELSIELYFGVPGCGKSTLASAFCYYWTHKRHVKTYSNFLLKDSILLDENDIGKYDFSNSVLIIDEIGAGCWNNRNWKDFPKETIKYLKYHRHFKTKIYGFSQSFNDVDVTYLRLCSRFYLVQKSIIPNVITYSRIYKYIGVDEESGAIVDKYKMDFWLIRPFTNKYIYAPKYRKLFNSFSTYYLPQYPRNGGYHV